MKPTLLEAIKQRPLLGDGAMGTQLMFAGLEQGTCGEAWNITHPEKVLAIQRRYAEAGSDCILTNTFGGSRIMLNRHGCRDQVVEVNQAAVRIAAKRSAIARDTSSATSARSAASWNPTATSPKQPGRAKRSTSRPAALVDAGADAIIIETQTGLEELGIAHSAPPKRPARPASSARWPTTSRSTARPSAP